MNYIRLSWKDIEEYCQEIVKQIQKSNWKPDTIISIGRGGMIPARLLSDLLKISDIYLYNIKLYKAINIRNQQPKVEFFGHNVENKIVLLVDDIIDSGITIEKAVEDFNMKKCKSVKTATLLCKDHVVRRPSYFSKLCEQDGWVVFPWEKE
jgi:hypothetical protein